VTAASADLGRKSLVLILGTWAASALGFLATVLVARRLGPEAVGALGFGFGLVGVLSAVLLPALAQAHLKRVAEGRDLGRCVATISLVQMASQGVMVLLVIALFPFRALVIPPGVPVEVIVFLVGAQFLSNLASSVTGAFMGLQWATAYGGTILAGRAGRFVTTVAVLVWAPDVRWVAATHVVEGALELALGAWILLGLRNVRLRSPDLDTLRAYWTHARPLLVTNPIGMLQDSLDRVLVARWAGLTAAGYYQVARGLWEILGTLNAYPFQLLFARLSQLFAARDPARDVEARRVFASAADKLLFLAVPVAFALWALRGPVITLLYGERFLPAVAPLMVFVVTALAQAALNPYHFVVYALDEHRRFIPVVLVRFPLYLLAMAALVPSWGATGAASVRFLLVVFPAWVYVRWTRELAGIGAAPWSWLYGVGFFVLVAVSETVRWGLGAVGTPGLVAMLTGMGTAAAAYALLLWQAHPGTAENLRYSRDLVDLRHLASRQSPTARG
jgi:O-antigen/teichoic acid export membrane protein